MTVLPGRGALHGHRQIPGSTVMPSVEITSAPAGTCSEPTWPTARMRSPSTRTTLFWSGRLPLPSMSVPPTSRFDRARLPAGMKGKGEREDARQDDKPPNHGSSTADDDPIPMRTTSAWHEASTLDAFVRPKAQDDADKNSVDSKTKYSGGSGSIYGERSYERWRVSDAAHISRASVLDGREERRCMV